MVKKKIKIAMLVAIIASLAILTGCSTNDELTWNDELENNNSSSVGSDNSENISPDNTSDNENYITVADIKSEYDTLLGSESKNQYMFKPFYNVEQTTEFTFSFKSKVDPIKAITVHTDEKCDYLSLVPQINSAYWTKDGIDVIVKPSATRTTLYSEGRKGAEKAIWGYAPIYYLCIRYDLDSTEVKKLENPIIIPFTVKSEISTPTVYANVDEEGTFSVKWNKVENAVKYKVYTGSDSLISSLTVAETGYQNTPKLVTTIDTSAYEFNPGYLLMQEKVTIGGTAFADNTLRETDSEYNLELVNRQNENLYNLQVIYITAVDKDGNESNFGYPVSLKDYKESLPRSVKDLNRYSELTEFPDTVKVESVDMKTAYEYPINFYKLEEPDEYSTYCDYRYEVIGTALKGIVTYKNEEKIFPAEHISDFQPKTSQMPQNTMDKIPQVTIDTFADSEYANSNIDLNKSVNYPENAKVELDAATLLLWTERDLARRIIPELGALDPREEFDSFIADGDPEYILKREGTTIVVEKVEKTSEEKPSIEEPKEEKPKEEKPEEKPSVEEPKEEKPEEKPNVEEPKEEKPEEKPNVEEPKEEKPEEKPSAEEPKEEKEEEPAKEVDNSNYVEEQKKSTEKQVEKANKEKVKTTNYPIFADTAGQKYLALAFINHQEKISLKAFPAYQNGNEIFDDLLYVWYQNPYIMTIDLENTYYDYNTQTLVVEYGVSAETTKQYQEAVYNKSKEVVKNIIKAGMSDYDKVVAIYEYLENNAKYNHEALDYGMAGNKDIYKKYPNSWNTYGILCEELGVCQSYAYAFKILAYESGLETVMVTGTMNNGGHAWNAVKLDGKWCMVDATNNGATSNLPYWICNASTDFIEGVNFKLNDGFVDGGAANVLPYINQDNSQDWYYVNNLYASSAKDCANIWFENRNQKIVSIKYSIKTQAEIKTFINEFVKEAYKLGATEEELGSVKCRAMCGIVLIGELN